MPSDLEKEFSIVNSTLEDIDFSMYNFIDNTLKIIRSNKQIHNVIEYIEKENKNSRLKILILNLKEKIKYMLKI